MAESPERLIAWTGERCVPWAGGVQGIHEHFHRYRFASGFAAGRRVLDLGSGEGYGAAMLARTANEVVAVDKDAAAIRHSRSTYPLDNLTFLQRSILQLDDFEPESFSAIVCLEVLEHIEEHEQLLAGVRRLLDEDGVFVASTPDRELYNSMLREPNPFHVRELDREAFRSLLSQTFPYVSIWGQRSVAGSRLVRLDEGSSGDIHETLVVRRGDSWVEESSVPPMFYIGVASRRPPPASPRVDYQLDPELEMLRELDRRLNAAEAQIEVMMRSRGWRAIESYRRARAVLARARTRPG